MLLSSVHKIDLRYKSTKLTKRLDFLACSCPQLRELLLGQDFENEHLKHLPPSLSKLHLDGACDLSESGLVYIASACIRGLESLHIKDCDGITDQALVKLPTTLQELHLEYYVDNGLRYRGKTFARQKITNAGLNRLGYLANLKVLKLSGCDRITSLPLGLPTTLQQLQLYDCCQIETDGLASLSSLISLTSLVINECPCTTDSAMLLMTMLSDLTSLELGGQDGKREITDAGLSSLSFLISLRHLSLHECNITGRGLSWLPSSLQTLSLGKCEEIDDTGLLNLSGLTELRRANLSGLKRITCQGIAYLPSSLSVLDLGFCRIMENTLSTLPTSLSKLYLFCVKCTDEGFQHLSLLSCLTLLQLCACKRMTDNALTYLPRSLISLTLWKCPNITDAGLRSLTALTRLQELHEGMTGITTAGKEEAKRILRCRILIAG